MAGSKLRRIGPILTTAWAKSGCFHPWLETRAGCLMGVMSANCEVPGCQRIWTGSFKGFAVCHAHLDSVIDWVREASVTSTKLTRDAVAAIVSQRSFGHGHGPSRPAARPPAASARTHRF